MICAHLRYWGACLVCAGYRVRPYDPLADRRRWAWQRPMRCGLGELSAPDWAALVAAIKEALGR